MEFSRQEYWSRLLFLSLGDFPNLGMESMSRLFPAMAGGFFTTVPPGKVSIALRIEFKMGFFPKSARHLQSGPENICSLITLFPPALSAVLILLLILQFSVQKAQYVGKRASAVVWVMVPVPNCLGSSPSSGPDWPDLIRCPSISQSLAQVMEHPALPPWDPGVRSALQRAWWSESRGEMIHQSKSGNVAPSQKSRCKNNKHPFHCHALFSRL